LLLEGIVSTNLSVFNDVSHWMRDSNGVENDIKCTRNLQDFCLWYNNVGLLALASSALAVERDSTVTPAPIALAILIAMCPRLQPNTNPLPCRLPLENIWFERRECRDTTEEWSNDSLLRLMLRHLKTKVLIHSNLVTVATRSHGYLHIPQVLPCLQAQGSRSEHLQGSAVPDQRSNVAVVAAIDKATTPTSSPTLKSAGTSNGANELSEFVTR
jgi:hypothetical protein